MNSETYDADKQTSQFENQMSHNIDEEEILETHEEILYKRAQIRKSEREVPEKFNKANNFYGG